MKISVSFFSAHFFKNRRTFLEHLLPDNRFYSKSLHESLKKIKTAGIEGIELGLHNNFSIQELNYLKSSFEKYNLKINSVHQPIRLLSMTKIKELTQLFITVKMLNASILVLHTDMAGKQLLDKNYINDIKKLEKKYLINACFENMQRHHLLIRNTLYWNPVMFQDFMGKNNLSITMDTTHLAQVGGDIIEFFKTNKKHIKNIHLSDFKKHLFSSSFRPAYHMHMPLGKGELPIIEFLQTLKKEKYSGNITMEISGRLDEVCNSAKLIRKHTN